MSDYLTRLAERTLDGASLLRPRARSLFEPEPSQPMGDVWPAARQHSGQHADRPALDLRVQRTSTPQPPFQTADVAYGAEQTVELEASSQPPASHSVKLVSAPEAIHRRPDSENQRTLPVTHNPPGLPLALSNTSTFQIRPADAPAQEAPHPVETTLSQPSPVIATTESRMKPPDSPPQRANIHERVIVTVGERRPATYSDVPEITIRNAESTTTPESADMFAASDRPLASYMVAQTPRAFRGVEAPDAEQLATPRFAALRPAPLQNSARTDGPLPGAGSLSELTESAIRASASTQAPARARGLLTAGRLPELTESAIRVSTPAHLRTARRGSPATRRTVSEGPAINVTIGRVEVRGTAPPASPSASRESAARAMSLEDYLARRSGRSGS